MSLNTAISMLAASIVMIACLPQGGKVEKKKVAHGESGHEHSEGGGLEQAASGSGNQNATAQPGGDCAPTGATEKHAEGEEHEGEGHEGADHDHALLDDHDHEEGEAGHEAGDADHEEGDHAAETGTATGGATPTSSGCKPAATGTTANGTDTKTDGEQHAAGHEEGEADHDHAE